MPQLRLHMVIVIAVGLCGIFIAAFGVGALFAVSNEALPYEQRPTINAHREVTQNVHSGYVQDKSFFDAAFEEASDSISDAPIAGLIVNHHLLAPHLIAQAVQFASGRNPNHIFLLSPNHLGYGAGNIISTNQDWATPYGILYTDIDLVKKLAGTAVTIEPRLFETEHGIRNIIPFIRHTFPEAKIIPLAIKETTPLADLDTLVAGILPYVQKGDLVIGSADFSHMLRRNAAEFHDQYAINELASLDFSGLNRLDVDSPETIYTLMQLMNQSGHQRFTLLANTNASRILEKPDLDDTTSYVVGAYSQGDKEPRRAVSLLVSGDTMLDRYVRQNIETHGLNDYFADAGRFTSGNDLFVTNLEGCFTDFAPLPLDPNNLIFTFDPSLIPVLMKHRVNAFNLSNNHSYNFGEEGFSQCRDHLHTNGAVYFGHPKNEDGISTTVKIRGISLALVSFNTLARTNLGAMTDEIRSLKTKNDLVAVFMHWGNEYQANAFSKSQQDTAHAFIDAGADVIFGSHPHVIQPIEEYKNKIIFYSLGNFIFDQTFSPDTQTGLMVGASLSDGQNIFYLYPFNNKGFKISFLSPGETDTLLGELAEKSQVSEERKKEIGNGILTIN